MDDDKLNKVINELVEHIESALSVDSDYVDCVRTDLLQTVVGLLKHKTGKWERHYSRPGVYADLYWWCPCCEQPTRYNDAGIFYQYCPHCGAKLEPCKDE